MHGITLTIYVPGYYPRSISTHPYNVMHPHPLFCMRQKDVKHCPTPSLCILAIYCVHDMHMSLEMPWNDKPVCTIVSS